MPPPRTSQRAHPERLLGLCALVLSVVVATIAASFTQDTIATLPPIDQRIEELLAQMTVEEKVNQLIIPEVSENELRTTYGSTGVGAYYIFDTNDRNDLQGYFLNSSRLGIPVSFVQEALHSGAAGGTIFPMPCGMASTWNPELIRQAHSVIALDARIIGADRTMSPNLNLYTDPRFGRIQEGFGEDPLLASQFAAAAVLGLQGNGSDSLDSYLDDQHIAATAKHFAAYGRTSGGQDGTAADISERTLREIYLKTFQAAVGVNVKAIMPAHNELDGVPCHGNAWLLTDILRNEWGWTNGLISSDYGDVAGIALYHLAADSAGAALLAINAGVDADLGASAFPTLLNSSKSGILPETVLDRAVRNVLRVKFAAGLFDAPFAQPPGVLDPPEHRYLAKEVATQGTVLLNNEDNLLPIDLSQLASIAVIGPNGNNSDNQVGGYTEMGAPIVTVLQGIQNIAGSNGINVNFEQGCYIDSTNTTLLQPAVKLASISDLAIIVVGDSLSTCQESWGGRTGDRADLDMSGGQLQLIESVIATGTPTVVVMINGRPQSFGYNNTLLQNITVLLEAWRPGEEGGNAIAELIFGISSPSGRLAVTFPWNVGEINGPSQPYWQKFRQYDGMMYTFFPSIPLFPFGWGLTYTTFEYSSLAVEPSIVGLTGSLNISVTITNTGPRIGTETPQLYIQDAIASVVRYKKQLFDFSQVTLSPGESTTVIFSLYVPNLAFYDINMQLVVEPGLFNLWVGPNALSGLSATFEVAP